MPFRVSLDTPAEHDGRPVFVNSPGYEGTFTWYAGQGDNVENGRGEGQLLWMEFSEPGSDSITWNYIEPTELHDGCVCWNPAIASWNFPDKWSFYVSVPGNTPVVNESNEGNCNLYEISEGAYIILPAAGDGTHDIDLETAAMVPDGYDEKKAPGNSGYWNVDRYWSETVTPSSDEFGAFNMYTFPINFYFCKNMHCGDPRGIWEHDADKAEWLSSKWTLTLSVTKSTSGTGYIGGWIKVFREHAEEY